MRACLFPVGIRRVSRFLSLSLSIYLSIYLVIGSLYCEAKREVVNDRFVIDINPLATVGAYRRLEILRL